MKVKSPTVITVAINMLIITFRTDRVFAPAAHQAYDLLGTEVLSQATLNCHLSLRGETSFICGSQRGAGWPSRRPVCDNDLALLDCDKPPDRSYFHCELNKRLSHFEVYPALRICSILYRSSSVRCLYFCFHCKRPSCFGKGARKHLTHHRIALLHFKVEFRLASNQL